MRVTLVGPTFPYKGGIAQHTTEMARRLARHGHDTRLLTWKAQYPRFLYPGELEIDHEEGEPCDEVRRTLAWYDPVGWWRAGRGLSGPDHLVVLCVVNGVQVPAYLAIARAARRSGATVVLLCHNVVPHDSGRVQRIALGHLMSSVGLVLVHSETEAAVARQLGATDVAVAALPPFFPVPIRRVDPPREPHHRILFFGFVRPYKGLDVLIEAMARVDSRVRLWIVGEFWTSSEATRRRITDLGLDDRIKIDDRYLPAEEVPALFERVDALVVPYRSGTGSQHPTLAHMAGIPAIVTSVGDLATRVRDGIDGYVCSPGDPDELARAIDRLYEPGELDRLRRASGADPTEAAWADYLASALGFATSETC